MKESQQTSSTRPDGATSNWQDIWRRTLAGAAGSAFGIPGLENYAGGFAPNMGLPDYGAVTDATKANFERQRGFAGQGADDYATKANAFGGDRAAIFKATALDDVNRNESEALANLGLQENQDKWSRFTQLMGLFGGAANVGGTTTTQSMPSNPLGQVAGAVTTFAGLPGLFNRGVRAAPNTSWLDQANTDMFSGGVPIPGVHY